jgi:hypothetical protein
VKTTGDSRRDRLGLFELVPDSAHRIKNHARNARRGETRDAWSRQFAA